MNCQPPTTRPLVTSAVEHQDSCYPVGSQDVFASDPLPKFPGLPLRSEMSLVLLGGNRPGLDLGEAAKSSPAWLCFSPAVSLFNCVLSGAWWWGEWWERREPWITVLWIRVRTSHSSEKEHGDIWSMHNPAASTDLGEGDAAWRRM